MTTLSAPHAQPLAPARRASMAAVWDRVRLTRPYSLLWFVATPVVTMALWLRGTAIPLHTLVYLLLSFLLADAGLTTLNDISDRDTDRASVERQRHTRPVAAGSVSVKAAYLQVVLLEAAALLAALEVSPVFLALVAGGVLYGVGYSVRPVYASGRPVISQIFWLVVWPALYLGVYIGVGGDFVRGLPYLGATMLFMGVGETLAKDIRDVDNDSATGKRTTPVRMGVDTTALMSVAAIAIGSIAYVAAAANTHLGLSPIVGTVLVVVALWSGRAIQLCGVLRGNYAKAEARALHMGCIRVFLTVNLLFITALGSK
jgi:4-hydroxybenzoate polyprenyltransferase